MRYKSFPAVIAFVFVLAVSSSGWCLEKFATFPVLPVGYTSIKVFDNQGRFVGRIIPEKRYWTPVERIPDFLQKALVAVEDSRFFEHNGIDLQGIARALVKDVVKRRLAEGGSTITQQLIKNKFLSGEKSIDRKISEARMALDFEKQYSKKQILEMYFNEIYYGNGAWGIAQAARIYFDKNPEELTESESVLLAGIPKNPGKYNPLGKTLDVSRRRDVVLKRMVDLNMITAGRRQQILNHPATVLPKGQAPYYVAHIRNKLVEKYGPDVIEYGGLEVTAAMDLNLQKLAEKALSEGVSRISPQLQGALVSVDPNTGDVLAAVGGVDFAKSNYNRAFLARRQPGSAIKPLIYAAALENGVTAASIWNDTPVSYDRGNGAGWKPLNYGRESYGELPLRKALAYSNNVITVKLLDALGVPNFVDFGRKMGLPLRSPNDLSLALGTDDVTLNDLVFAYTPFATGGLRPEPRTIIRIYDRRRGTWMENAPSSAPILTPAAAYITTQMLKDVMVYGTAKGLKKFSAERPSAGKTGTTDDYRDTWFVGYTPQLVTGVWVGHDKPKPGGKGFTGGAVAAPIWEKFMRPALAGKPAADFPQPDSVISVTVDPTTGMLAAPDCPSKRDEYFVAGSQPSDYCTKHGGKPPLLPVVPLPDQGQEPSAAVLPQTGGAQDSVLR